MAKKDYTNWNRNDLIKEIEQLRKRKKYGLVWEDKPENVVEQCKTELPVLEEVKNKEIITDPDKPVNLLIEGDNYHALSVLNYTHKGKIDVIYIDPPYNTGNKDFVYNDQYVDKEDAYRHSKWVSFMSKRLELAKSLLSKDGIIFISIDDNELAQLKMLCDEIFGENNFVSLNVVESGEVFGTKAAHADKTFVKVKDYVLVYTKNKGALKNKQPLYDATRELYDPHFGTIIEDDLSKKTIENLLTQEKWVKELFEQYKIKINKKNINTVMNLNEKFREFIYLTVADKLYTDQPFTKKLDPVFVKKLEPGKPFKFEDKILFKTSAGTIRMYVRFKESIKKSDDYNSIYTRCTLRGDLWKGFHTDMRNIQDEGGIDFKNGKKPIRLMKQLIKWFNKKDAVVLDFFAGSGSTGHAVIDLNRNIKEFNLRYILCTYNEENGNGKIIDKYCYPRLKNVIKGSGKIANAGGNLKYFKTSFVPAEPTDKNKIALTEKATEMLCVKEDTFEEVKTTKQYKIFRNKKRYTGIVFDHQAIDDFKKEIVKIDGKFNLYIFSLGDDTFDEEFEDMKKKVKLSPIPEAILRVYRRIFK